MSEVTYTITLESAKVLAELNGVADYEYEDVGGKTFTGFVLVESGMFEGDYAGVIDGEDVIFLVDEIVAVTPETK
jgi:hypothetical protein